MLSTFFSYSGLSSGQFKKNHEKDSESKVYQILGRIRGKKTQFGIKMSDFGVKQF